MKLERDNIKLPIPCSSHQLGIADDWGIVCLALGLRCVIQKEMKTIWRMKSEIWNPWEDHWFSFSFCLAFWCLKYFYFFQKDFKGYFNCFKLFFELPSYTRCQRSDTTIWPSWHNPSSGSAGGNRQGTLRFRNRQGFLFIGIWPWHVGSLYFWLSHVFLTWGFERTTFLLLGLGRLRSWCLGINIGLSRSSTSMDFLAVMLWLDIGFGGPKWSGSCLH